MCSISTSETIDEHFDELKRSGQKDKLKKRLIEMATEASMEQPGALDNPSCIMMRMPEELRHVRKYGFGAHRVYFTGKNTDCSYRAFYVKAFKKSGVDNEDDKAFQARLIKTLSEPITHTYPDTDTPELDKDNS